MRRLLLRTRTALGTPVPNAERLLRAMLVAMLVGLAVGLLLGVRLVLAAPAPDGSQAAGVTARGAGTPPAATAPGAPPPR
jgi:hypothetical protein